MLFGTTVLAHMVSAQEKGLMGRPQSCCFPPPIFQLIPFLEESQGICTFKDSSAKSRVQPSLRKSNDGGMSLCLKDKGILSTLET